MVDALLVVVALFVLILHIQGIAWLVEVAKQKGHAGGSGLIWLLSLFTGVFGYLLVISLPDKTMVAQNERIIGLLEGIGGGSSNEGSLPPL